MEKQLIPQLRFPEFNDEWFPKKLGDISILTSSKRVYLEDYVTEGIPFFRGKEITELKNKEKPTDILYISKERYNDFKEKYGVPKKGDILVTAVGTLGNVWMIENNSPFYFKDGNLIWLKNIKEDSSFLEKLIQLNTRELIKTSIGSTQKALTMVELRKINLKFPQLSEQQKIASFLSDVDDKITKLNKKKELIEKYKKGIMQKIFNQELRFKDDEGNEFPKWEENKLADFKGLVHGDGDWILSKDISKKGDYQIVQLGNIGFGLYVEKKLKTITSDKFTELKGTLINKGDLLINRMVDGALNCCILKKDGNYITSVDVCWIRQNDYFNNYFLMSLILFGKNQNKLLNLSSGSGRVRISKKNLFNEFSFKLPSKQEQTKIVNFLSDIDLKIEVLNNKIDNSKNFKKGLLQKMFV